MVFAIGENDYSDKVIMDTYQVNRISVFTQWEDANGVTHRDEYRTKIQGSFSMDIRNLSEYQAFIDDVQAHMQNGGYVTCKVAANNLNQENVVADLFIDYTPLRTINNNFTKSYESFTVSIEER